MTPIQYIARVCHEANRAWCLTQGDTSQVPWEEASNYIRASVIAGVEGILAGNTPAQSHEAWCQYRRDAGWVRGPVKSEALKTHPNLRPYSALPEAERRKDHLFAGIVHALS